MATHSLFLSGESQGQRSLLGYSQWGHKELDMTEQLSFLHFKSSKYPGKLEITIWYWIRVRCLTFIQFNIDPDV